MPSIGGLNYQLTANTAGFTRGLLAARSELAQARRVMSETVTPAQQMGESLDRLKTLLDKELISLEGYNAALAKLQSETPEAVAAQQQHAAAVEAGQRVLTAIATPLDNYRQKLADAKTALDAGQISAAQFNTRKRQLADLLPEVKARQQAANEADRDAAAIAQSLLGPKDRYLQQVRRARELLAAGKLSQEQYNQHVKRLGGELPEVKERQEALNAEVERAKQIAQQTLSPLARYRQGLDELQGLLDRGRISQEQFNAAKKQLQPNVAANIPGLGRFMSMIGQHPAITAAAIAVAALAAAYKAAQVAVRQTLAAMTEIDEIAKASRVIGTTTEGLIALRKAAAEMSGVAGEQVDAALTKMRLNLGQAAGGSGEAVQALKTLGVSIGDLSGQSADQQFRTLAASIAQVRDGATQAHLATKLFGEGGVQLLDTLRAGGSVLDAYTETVDRLRLSFSETEAAQVEAANDALARAGDVFTGVWRQVAIEAAPALQMMADWFVMLTDDSSEFGKTVRAAIGYVGIGLAKIVDVGNLVVGHLQQAQGGFLNFVGTILQGAARIDSALATITGRKANTDLAAMAKRFVDDGQRILVEGTDRLMSGLRGEASAKFAEMKAAFPELAAQQQKLREQGFAAAEAAKAAAAAAEANAAAQQKADDAAQDLVKSLQQELALFGLTGRAAERKKLALEGANAETLATAAALAATLDRLELERDLSEQTKQLREEIARIGQPVDDSGLRKLQERGATEQQLAGLRALQQQRTVMETLAKLREEIATSGKSADELALRKLQAEGANEQQLAEVRALQQQRTEVERIAKLRQDAAALSDSQRSEADKRAEQLARYREMLAMGLIDLATFQKAIAQTRAEVNKPFTLTGLGRGTADALDRIEEAKQRARDGKQQQQQARERLPVRPAGGDGAALSPVVNLPPILPQVVPTIEVKVPEIRPEVKPPPPQITIPRFWDRPLATPTDVPRIKPPEPPPRVIVAPPAKQPPPPRDPWDRHFANQTRIADLLEKLAAKGLVIEEV